MTNYRYPTSKKISLILGVSALLIGQLFCNGGLTDGGHSNSDGGDNSQGPVGGHGTIYLSKAGNNTNTGGMDDPVATLAQAVEIAGFFDTAEIRIGAGIYTVDDAVERLDVSEAGVVVPRGVSIYGGYSATDWTVRDPEVHETVVKGTATGDAGYFSNPNRVFQYNQDADLDTVLDGVTIRAGGGDYSAGVLILDGSPTIQNNIIYGGTGSSWSVGLKVIGDYTGSTPLIRGNVIKGGGGSETVYSYAVQTEGTQAQIEYNQLEGGTGNTGRWGVDCYYSADRIFNNNIRFSGNETMFGIQLTGCFETIAQNVIVVTGNALVKHAIYSGASFEPGEVYILSNYMSTGSDIFGTVIELFEEEYTIENNLIEVQGANTTCVEAADGTRKSVAHNNFRNCSILLNQYGDFTTYGQLCSGNIGNSSCSKVLTGPPATGNTGVDPQIIEGTNGFDWTASTPGAIRTGGKNLSDYFNADFYGRPRTGPWSIGPFQK